MIAPYTTRPGQVPRKIEIERKKRLYASQDITKILLAEGVDHSKPAESAFAHIGRGVPVLPLEVFDNENFEERTPNEWMRIAHGKDGSMVGLPAKALHVDKQGAGAWKDGRVVGYAEKEKKYEVHWSDISLSPSFLARMHVCFKAEDPFRFCKRVADAHRRRREAEMTILYNLYIDSMPREVENYVDPEQAKRILASAYNNRQLVNPTSVDSSPVIAEVRNNFARTMNKVVFDAFLEEFPGHPMLQDLVMPPAAVPGPERINGCIELPEQEQPIQISVGRGTLELLSTSFQEKSRSYYFNSFLTKLELIKVLVQLRQECLKALQMNFFATVTKSVRLEEFVNLQSSTTAATSTFLKDSWASAVQNHVRANLKEMKKGWFNLEETNNEVYNFSKLKKFLACVNFTMQDTLRFLIEDSLRNYAGFLMRASDYTVRISGPSKVEVLTRQGEPIPPLTLRMPLFVVDLQLEGTGTDMRFSYSTPIDSFLESPLLCFDKALTQIQSMVRIERRVMKKLFWSFDPVMNTVHPSEEWVVKLRGEVEETLKR